MKAMMYSIYSGTFDFLYIIYEFCIYHKFEYFYSMLALIRKVHVPAFDIKTRPFAI